MFNLLVYKTERRPNAQPLNAAIIYAKLGNRLSYQFPFPIVDSKKGFLHFQLLNIDP